MVLHQTLDAPRGLTTPCGGVPKTLTIPALGSDPIGGVGADMDLCAEICLAYLLFGLHHGGTRGQNEQEDMARLSYHLDYLLGTLLT